MAWISSDNSFILLLDINFGGALSISVDIDISVSIEIVYGNTTEIVSIISSIQNFNNAIILNTGSIISYNVGSAINYNYIKFTLINSAGFLSGTGFL